MTDWTEEMYVILDSMSREGCTLLQIGTVLGVSKGAVAGKRWRRELPKRASPFPPGTKFNRQGPKKIDRPERKRSDRPVPRPTLTLVPLVSVQENAMPKKQHVEHKPEPKRAVPCSWPVSQRGRDWLMCEAPSVPGKPYCADHCKLAYVRLRDRREDQAA